MELVLFGGWGVASTQYSACLRAGCAPRVTQRIIRKLVLTSSLQTPLPWQQRLKAAGLHGQQVESQWLSGAGRETDMGSIKFTPRQV